MKKQKAIISVAVSVTMVLALLGLSGCGGQTSELSMADEVSAYVDNIDMEYAYDTTYNLAYNDDLHSSELGFRTAGSDAEHKAADYLAGEMKKLGLEDIEKVPVSVDK
ncbi:MAG: hypothetical protein ACI4LK_06000 [Lentihominibacter sp.]